MKTGLLIFGLLCAASAYAGPASSKTPDQIKDEDLISKVAAAQSALDERLPKNQHGVALPTLEYPAQILGIVRELQQEINSSKNRSFNKPESAREVVVSALEMLYRGRGTTTSRDGKGWNPAGFENTGLTEIAEILNSGFLDEKGLKQFQDFVQAYDFNSASNRRAAGFPGEIATGTAEIKDKILSQVSKAPRAASLQPDVQKLSRFQEMKSKFLSSGPGSQGGGPFQPNPEWMLGQHSSLSDIVDQAVKAGKISQPEAEAIKGRFANTLNHFDIIGDKLNQGDAPPFYGRSDELNQIADGLSRGEKQHVLIQGKAGVGKTTLIKILQTQFLLKQRQIRGEEPPIFIEIPITLLTNPTDPTPIQEFLQGTVNASKRLGRRFVIFADEAHAATPMTQNAMKSFLTEVNQNIPSSAKVNVILGTTAGEARGLENDSAFVGRFTSVHVDPFNQEDTIRLVKESKIPQWQRHHVKDGYFFNGEISQEALDYAYHFRGREQKDRETGTHELLEGTIVEKLNRNTDAARTRRPLRGGFGIDVDDIRTYLKSKYHTDLLPGDPDFNANFDKKWEAFEKEFGGNEGAKEQIKETLRTHFAQLTPKMASAIAVFGPPGSGKSNSAEKIAKNFFKGAILTTNGAENKNGGTELNKLIGSPTGHSGAEAQRSVLTKMLKDHPEGFVWKIEEADYLHQDVLQLLTNIISDKKFTDGLGKEWDASKIFIWMNSNVGQDLMIPKDSKNKMTWEQYKIRRNGLVEKQVVDGKTVEVARPSKVAGVFEQFIETIVKKSNPNGDGSEVSQEASKQKSRYKPVYFLPPTQEELEKAAEEIAALYVKNAKTYSGVDFHISKETVSKALDMEHYDFEKGYRYVDDQLQRKLYNHLDHLTHRRGETITAEIVDTKSSVGDRVVASQDLKLKVGSDPEKIINLGARNSTELNPWGSSPEMMAKIRNLPREMRKRMKGNSAVIQDITRQVKDKSANWDKKINITLLGTSGNGKTETFKALAVSLFGSEDALKIITGIDHPWDLSDHFRPPTGVEGGKDETETERWFHSRRNAGGGIILFDELLSEISKGSDQTIGGQKGGKIAVLREIYQLLAERKLRIGNRIFDADGFIIGMTGNSLQELFDSVEDSPEAEALVTKILGILTPDRTIAELKKRGLDAPIIARLGSIHVLGPQPKEISHQVGEMKVQEAIEDIQEKANHPIEIDIAPEAVGEVVDRLSTVKLGMRSVEAGFDREIFQPLRGIIQDMDPVDPIQKIQFKVTNGKAEWLVTNQAGETHEVGREAYPLGDGLFDENWKKKSEFDSQAKDTTPQFSELETAKPLELSPEMVETTTIHEVYGHWMVHTLLTHQNNAALISTITGENYAGKVASKVQAALPDDTLLSMTKEAVMLQAGHRAPFRFGKFSTGGGNGGQSRGKNENPSDDLGKIDVLFDRMINNGLIPGISESSPDESKNAFKEAFSELTRAAADQLIDQGVKSGQFKEAYDKVTKDRYMNEAQLDQHVSKIDFSRIGNPDALLSRTLINAVEHLPSEVKISDLTRQALMRTIDRVMTESKVRNSREPAAYSEIAGLQEKLRHAESIHETMECLTHTVLGH